MKNATANLLAKPALNANASPVSAPKRRAGRVAVDANDATQPNVAAHGATPKSKTKSKDNPLAGRDAARAATPDAKLSAKPDGKASAKPRDARSAKPAATKAPQTGRAKLSALDAAALVLADLPKSEAAGGISANDLIDRMQSRGLWQSPGGKTPSATLYAAMMREVADKGEASRFARVAKGRFTLASGIMKPAKSAVAKPLGNAAAKGDAKSPAKTEPKPSSAKLSSVKPASKSGAKA